MIRLTWDTAAGITVVDNQGYGLGRRPIITEYGSLLLCRLRLYRPTAAYVGVLIVSKRDVRWGAEAARLIFYEIPGSTCFAL